MHFVPVELGDAGVLAPGRWRWLRALLWMVAGVALIGLAFNAGAWLQVHALPDVPRDRRVLLLGDVFAYLVYIAMVISGERRRPSELASLAAPIDLGIGLLVGAGMFTLVFAILRLAGAYTLTPGAWSDWGHDLLFTLSTGLHEELIARLLIFRLVMRAFGVTAALLVSAALFGAAHLANPNASAVAAVAIAVEAGLMLATFYLLTGRIWMAVGVHAAWNLFQGSVFGARVSGFSERGSLFTSAPVPGAPDWLSGGAFGPEASLPAVVVGLAVFALVLTRWRARETERVAAPVIVAAAESESNEEMR